jgi:protein TonB
MGMSLEQEWEVGKGGVMSPATMSREPEVQEQALAQGGIAESANASVPQLSIPQPSLFADVLLEVDSAETKRRKWAAASSIIFQSLIIGALLVVPLMFTEALPPQQLLTFLVAPPPPPPPPPPAAAAAQVVRQVSSNMVNGGLRMPSAIPQKIAMIHEDEAPPVNTGGGVIGGVPGGIPGGQLGGVIGGIISSTASTAVVPKLAAPTVPKRIRISQGVTKGLLIQKVEPKYPVIAMNARIQGVVLLTAFISKTGEIENLQAVSGHPMLVPAAIEAVKQWKYRPYYLNGEPMEVETQITVTFQFAQ